MPVYIQWGLDGPKGPDVRKTTRPAHLAWLETLGGAYKAGSPLMAEDGVTPAGSVIVIEAGSLAEAKAIFAEDPYMKAGIWDRIDVRQMGSWKPR